MFRKLSVKEMLRNEESRSRSMELLLNQENQKLGTEISEREINEIILGMQVSDLEIQLLELQLGGV